MLFVLTLALFAGLASSRPSDKAIVDIDPRNQYCGCSTVDLPQCGCCVDLEEIIQENYTVCTNLTYVEAEYGVRFTLTINGEVLLNETISGRNPPALCEGLRDVADICVQVYNMSYEEEKFGGCLRIYGDVVTRVLDIELGCYYMPLSDGQLIETAVDEQALVHSLFQISNSAKDLILDEMHKWSHKDGDLVSVEPDFVEDEPCGCYKDPVPQCGCCGKFEFEGKHHSVCMNMTHVKEKHGLRLTIVSDDKVLLDETISVKHPPPYCQGICSTGCICENYYNMSFGDDGKWGGCLEIYGDLKIHAFNINFGCYYLPVNQAEQKPIVDEPYQSVLFNDIQQWYRNTLTKKMRDRRLKKKNSLYFLYKNSVEKDNLK